MDVGSRLQAVPSAGVVDDPIRRHCVARPVNQVTGNRDVEVAPLVWRSARIGLGIKGSGMLELSWVVAL